jgi:four helix bundle protein
MGYAATAGTGENDPMRSYQTLVAWKRAHQALLLALRATDAAYHPRAKNLFDQLRRATISIEANIVEGYALNTPGLCRRHLRIAIGSAAEAECLVRAAGELGYLNASTVTALEGALDGALGALHGLLRSPPVTAT